MVSPCSTATSWAVEASGRALGEVAELERAEPDPLQGDDLVADGLRHPPHLAVAPLAEDDLDLALAAALDPGRGGDPVVELHALREPPQVGLRGRPPQLDR